MEWKKYYEKKEGRKPREQLVRAISFCKKRVHALDLGSGNFIESKFLAKRFQRVTSIDSSPDALKYDKNLSKKIFFLNVPFNEVDFSQYGYGLINAQFSLPFYGKKGFQEFIEMLIASLHKDGIFVGQLFGTKDGFNGKYDMAFHTKNRVKNILKGFKILEFIEEEKEGKTVMGEQKHWHIFHFIAKKV